MAVEHYPGGHAHFNLVQGSIDRFGDLQGVCAWHLLDRHDHCRLSTLSSSTSLGCARHFDVRNLAYCDRCVALVFDNSRYYILDRLDLSCLPYRQFFSLDVWKISGTFNTVALGGSLDHIFNGEVVKEETVRADIDLILGELAADGNNL